MQYVPFSSELGSAMHGSRPTPWPALALLCAVAVSACDGGTEERVVDFVVPVTVQPVRLGTIEATVVATGTLRARREAAMASEIRGNLHYVAGPEGRKPAEGAPVRAGQIIATLDSEEFIIGVREESARLAVANAERNLAEKEALFEEGLSIESDVDTARKQLADARAELENALIQLQKVNVVAPIDGFLAELTSTTESTLVDQGDVIGKVVDYGEVVVELKIPNSQMHRVVHDQLVRVRNYALPDEVFAGRVTVVAPALDAATRTVAVEAVVGNREHRLRPGMFVQAEIVTEAREDVVVVPRDLVLTRQNQSVVFVEEQGQAMMRQVVLGMEDEVSAEVLEGVAEGDRLITSNYETLRSRTQVRVTGESSVGQGD